MLRHSLAVSRGVSHHGRRRFGRRRILQVAVSSSSRTRQQRIATTARIRARTNTGPRLSLGRCDTAFHESFVLPSPPPPPCPLAVIACYPQQQQQALSFSSSSSSSSPTTRQQKQQSAAASSSSSSSENQNQNHHNNDGEFLKKNQLPSWKLYTRPIGSLNSKDWMRMRLGFLQAGDASNKSHSSPPSLNALTRDDSIRYGFAMLDRMAAEQRAHHSLTNENGGSTLHRNEEGNKDKNDFMLPIVDRPWVLNSWRKAMQQPRQRRRRNNNNNHHDHYVLPSLEQVVDKMETYLELGLIPWTNASMAWIIEVMKQETSPQQAPVVAMGILKRLETAAAASTGSTSTTTTPTFPRNKVLTTHLVELWAKSQKPKAPKRAMDLLEELKETYRVLKQQQQQQQQVLLAEGRRTPKYMDADDLDSFYRPDGQLYAVVMHAWARSTSAPTSDQSHTSLAPHQAADLLLEAQDKYDIQPTLFLYNNVIHAITNQVHAKIGSYERNCLLLREATGVLEGIIDTYREDSIGVNNTISSSSSSMLPTAASYSSILSAHARMGQLHHALAILHEMQDLAESTNQPDIAPNQYCWDRCSRPLRDCLQEHQLGNDNRHAKSPNAGVATARTMALDKSTSPWQDHDLQQAAAYLQALYQESSSTLHNNQSVKKDNIEMMDILPLLDRLCFEMAMAGPAGYYWDTHRSLFLVDSTGSSSGGAANDEQQVNVISSLVDLALQSWDKKKHQKPDLQIDSRLGILKRLVQYQQVGLLQPTNVTLNWMIASMEWSLSKSKNRQGDDLLDSSVALRTQEMVDMARQACDYNVHDKLYHPKQVHMTRLAQLWAETAPVAEQTIDSGQQHLPTPTTAPHLAAENALALSKDWYHETNQQEDMKPDVPMYNAVVRALVRHGPNKDQVAQRTMELLTECFDTCGETTTKHDHDVAQLYESVFHAFVQSSLTDQAHVFFLNLLGTYLSQDDKDDVIQNGSIVARDNLSTAMATLADASARIVSTASTTTKQPSLVSTSSLRPTPAMIWSLVSAHSSQERPDLADALLQTMEALYQETGDENLLPETKCYNMLMNSYAKMGQPEKAEATLDRMQRLATITSSNESLHGTFDTASKRTVMEPDLRSWNAMLTAWAKSGSPDAAKRASTILEQLQKASPALAPDTYSYNLVLECYWKSPHHQTRHYALATEQILESMKASENARPNANSYLLALFVMRKSGWGDRAIALLEQFCRLYLEGKTMHEDEGPRTRHLNIVIEALAWSRTDPDAFNKAIRVVKVMSDLHSPKRGLITKPNRDTFECLFKCAEACGTKDDRPEKAEEVLSLMRQQRGRGKDESSSVKPDANVYSRVIAAWRKSNRQDAGRRIDILLDRMQSARIQPNRHCFVNAMAVFRKLGRPEKVQAQFDAMLKAWKEGRNNNNATSKTLQPIFTEYVTLLEAWAEAGQAPRAAAILEQLLAEIMEGRIKGGPLTRPFTDVIRAWAKSPRPDAAAQAEKLLETMERLSSSSKKKYPCRPNAETYAVVIEAQQRSDKPGAAERANQLSEKLQALEEAQANKQTQEKNPENNS